MAASKNTLTNTIAEVQAELGKGRLPLTASSIPLIKGYKNSRKLGFLCEIYKCLHCLFMKECIAVVQRIIFKTHKHTVVQTADKRLLCTFLLYYQVRGHRNKGRKASMKQAGVILALYVC